MTRYSPNSIEVAALAVAVLATFLATSCSRKSDFALLPKPTGFGAAIVETSGGKQLAQTGARLPQPVVVQVNDGQGTAVAGAWVEFAGPEVTLDPPSALTDASGQVTTNVSLGGMAGPRAQDGPRGQEFAHAHSPDHGGDR